MRNRFGKLAVVAGALAAAVVTAAAVPAGASPIPNTGPTILTCGVTVGVCQHSLAAAGSDTSYWMMQNISPQYNVNTTKNVNTDFVTQIPPVNSAPFPAGAYVPEDSVAPAYTWTSLTTVNGPCGGGSTPPNGSSAGISCLLADKTGQVDFARSSRGRKSTDPANLEFWAYAIGAVDWVKFAGSHAPASLTPTQLKDIMTCHVTTGTVDGHTGAAGTPIIANWIDAGGTSGVIHKYAPQTSSGTYSFTNSNVLNGNTIDTGCVGAANLTTFLEEHDARGVSLANKAGAIYFFDYGRWTAQSKQFEADLRNGATLGAINGTTPSPATVNPAGTFIDSRWIYNVVRTDSHPSSYTTQTQDVKNLVGVTAPSTIGYICSGAAAQAITLAGFVPIASGPTLGAGNPASTCRFEPPAIP